MSEFKREERYVVIKIADLDMWQAPALRQLLNDFDIPTREGVFIESDWEVYEDAWKLVEQEWEQDNE